jgi:hypothetical protein
MKSLAALLVTLLWVAPSLAGEYQSATVAQDMSFVAIATQSGEIHAPRTLDDQQGFSDALVSPNGSLVGWLALVGNCCTSYPLPMALVIFRHGQVIRTISEKQPIFHWSFVRQGTAVAYQQTFPHGLVPYFYKLRRISDGKLLEEFDCRPKETEVGTPAEYENDGPVPPWVWPLAELSDCPVRAHGS